MGELFDLKRAMLWAVTMVLGGFFFLSVTPASAQNQESDKAQTTQSENSAQGQASADPKSSSSIGRRPPSTSPAPEVNVHPGVRQSSQGQAVPFNDSSEKVEYDEDSIESENSASNSQIINNPGQKNTAAQRHQAAFEASLENLLPITPEQVEIYRKKVDKREKALTDTPPAAVGTKTYCIKLEPGFIPPVIKLTPNFITSLVLVDANGYPWPITSASLGSGELFNVQVLGNDTRNQVLLSPLTAHGNSNLVLTLTGNDVPLMLLLETESGVNRERHIDGMIVFQIQGRGPNAPPPIVAYPVQGPVNDILLTIMDGITPSGSSRLRTLPELADTKFIQLGERIYVRTKNRLMWPSHTAVLSGVGGFSVYEIPVVSSVMISEDGQVKTVTVKNAQGIDVGGLQ